MNVNHKILVWARKTSGYTIDEVAPKIKVKTERLKSWESGKDKPTWNQLRNISNVYKRPSALFFGSKVPLDRPLLPDYRVLPETELEHIPELIFEIREAYERRDIALELLEKMGEDIPNFSFEGDITDNPENLANRIRNMLGLSIEEQFSWTDEYTALRSWISAIENSGVLVFQLRGIEVENMRGYSINERPLPVIGLNIKDSVRGRIFTLLHELTHIVLDNEGVCDLSEDLKDDSVEAYCNRVAGAILVPKMNLLNEKTVTKNHGLTWEEGELKRLANRFKVSQEVILRRLLIFKRTTNSFYKSKREEFQKIVPKKSKSKGGPSYHLIILNKNGRYYTNLVISAYHNNVISAHDVSNFLGGVKLEHVNKIENSSTSVDMGG